VKTRTRDAAGEDAQRLLLHELAESLEEKLIHAHRSKGAGELAWDTVYYFETPALDQMMARQSGDLLERTASV